MRRPSPGLTIEVTYGVPIRRRRRTVSFDELIFLKEEGEIDLHNESGVIVFRKRKRSCLCA
jgi:hypothetical protein